MSFKRNLTNLCICFNPCSYGSFVLTLRFMLTVSIWRQSFNPCSYGSFVLTDYVIIEKKSQRYEFQSLFLWIFRSYRFIFQSNQRLYVFVSILVLMDLSFLLKRDYSNGGSIRNVSILVLMDLPFLQHKPWIKTFQLISFNPCSYGSFVLTSNAQRIFKRILEVSILVLMDLSFLHFFKLRRE